MGLIKKKLSIGKKSTTDKKKAEKYYEEDCVDGIKDKVSDLKDKAKYARFKQFLRSINYNPVFVKFESQSLVNLAGQLYYQMLMAVSC